MEGYTALFGRSDRNVFKGDYDIRSPNQQMVQGVDK